MPRKRTKRDSRGAKRRNRIEERGHAESRWAKRTGRAIVQSGALTHLDTWVSLSIFTSDLPVTSLREQATHRWELTDALQMARYGSLSFPHHKQSSFHLKRRRSSSGSHNNAVISELPHGWAQCRSYHSLPRVVAAAEDSVGAVILTVTHSVCCNASMTSLCQGHPHRNGLTRDELSQSLHSRETYFEFRRFIKTFSDSAFFRLGELQDQQNARDYQHSFGTSWCAVR